MNGCDYKLLSFLSGFSSDEETPPPQSDKRTYMNQPHLRFEITSDDGFSVKADSIEGKNSFLCCRTTIKSLYMSEDRKLKPHSQTFQKSTC